MMTSKTVLITGTSSGIGNAAVKYFSDKGWNVAATMRKPGCAAGEELAKLPNVIVLLLDVTEKSTVTAAVTETIEKFGALDVVVNNAGYGLAGPLEFVTEEQLARQYATNVFGPIYVMQAALPHFRERGGGVMCNVTSVGGRMALPFNSLYHGTKFGLEGISESAALEWAPLGIKVKIVEPGGVKTDFSGRSLDMTTNQDIKAYDDMMAKTIAGFSIMTGGGSDPSVIAQSIFDAVTDDSDKIRYPAGDDAHQMLSHRYSISDEDHQKEMLKKFNFIEE